VVTANNFSGTVSVLVNAFGRCAVPNIGGGDGSYRLAAAKRILARANCHPGTIRYVYSKTEPRGWVLSQRPSSGAVLPKGGEVNLVVSKGKRR
jgi:beta-lactam-binding protein with PASTA domain